MNRPASDADPQLPATRAPAAYGIAGIAVALFVAAVGLLLNFV
jgi:hypothetical protein